MKGNFTKGLERKSTGMLGKCHTEETKQKMSLSRKGKYAGKNHPLFGKHHSKETKQKMSLANKGRKLTFEHKQAISNALKGRHLSPSFEFKSGYKQSEETKQKISKTLTGRSPTLVTLQKMRKSMLRVWQNKELSEETREKLRVASAKATSPFENSSIEIAVFDLLDSTGVPYLKHCYLMSLLGSTPYKYHKFDVVIPEQQIIIEVQGCYWHGCSDCFQVFNKIQLNSIQRDEDLRRIVDGTGWTLIELWEHDIKSDNMDWKEVITCR